MCKARASLETLPWRACLLASCCWLITFPKNFRGTHIINFLLSSRSPVHHGCLVTVLGYARRSDVASVATPSAATCQRPWKGAVLLTRHWTRKCSISLYGPRHSRAPYNSPNPLIPSGRWGHYCWADNGTSSKAAKPTAISYPGADAEAYPSILGLKIILLGRSVPESVPDTDPVMVFFREKLPLPVGSIGPHYHRAPATAPWQRREII